MTHETSLGYPDPPLADGVVLLRRWETSDLPCVEAASSDPRIPAGTTVPRAFSREEGLAWIARQWGRSEAGEGWSLAIAEAGSGEAVGVVACSCVRTAGAGPGRPRSVTGSSREPAAAGTPHGLWDSSRAGG